VILQRAVFGLESVDIGRLSVRGEALVLSEEVDQAVVKLLLFGVSCSIVGYERSHIK
jgi:hypothetical protein